MEPAEQRAALLACDAQLAKLSAGLDERDLGKLEKTRKKLNSWLDTRLELMEEEEGAC